jgi:hypothetical protein
LKKFIESVKEWKKDHSEESIARSLKSHRKDVDKAAAMMIEIAKISMYIIASKVNKETLKIISETHPDNRLISEFIKF